MSLLGLAPSAWPLRGIRKGSGLHLRGAERESCSVLPTEGEANPALAIMALSDRLARLLAGERAASRPAALRQGSARRTRRLRRGAERRSSAT